MSLITALRTRHTGNVITILRRMGLTIWSGKPLKEMTDEEVSAVIINWICHGKKIANPLPMRVRVKEDQEFYELSLMKIGRWIKMRKIEKLEKMEGCKLYIWPANLRIGGIKWSSIFTVMEAADLCNNAWIKKEQHRLLVYFRMCELCIL